MCYKYIVKGQEDSLIFQICNILPGVVWEFTCSKLDIPVYTYCNT